ncbi:MAG: aldo/keto reductase [Betaproteobacteria bacterium]|nr:aldo/keto reductase [Betaproteobacteria bacterium]
MKNVSRREFAARLAALGATGLLPSLAQGAAADVITRSIPSSGERLPAIGLGTSRVFNVGDDAARRAGLAEVLRNLLAGGGTIIDTATSYGSSEGVVGDLVAQAGLRKQVFIATKLRSPDAAELRGSLARLHSDQVDLLFLHNVRDPNQDLGQFRAWKAAGVCRYFGVTSTYEPDYPAVEAVLRREKCDFIEIDYSLDNREVEARLLPLAAEMKAAVLIALPFGRARLFRAVRGKTLPDWAKEFDAASWAQFFLKFVLGHAAVTAAIPGTSDPAHMADNIGAMRGRLPDAAQRRRMIEFLQTL